jgi:hypothetical protein
MLTIYKYISDINKDDDYDDRKIFFFFTIHYDVISVE